MITRLQTALRRVLAGWRLLDGVWLAVLAWYIVAGVDLTPFHGDESTQLFMSHDYHYLVYERDFARVRFDRDAFNDPKDELALRLLNGTVGKMAMGLAWDLAGLTVHDLNQQWEWNYEDPDLQSTEWDWNHKQRRVPSDRLLHAGRMSSTLFTVAAAWAIFVIAWLVFQEVDPRWARLAAWAASLIFATHPNMLLNGRRSTMEGALAALAALTVIVGLLILRALRDPGTRPRTLWAWMLVLSAVAGTAMSSKHPAMLTVVPVYAAVVLGPPGWQITRLHIWRLIVSTLMMGVVFLAWNPAWWTLDPMLQLRVLERRGSLAFHQTLESRDYGLVHEGLLDRADTFIGSMFSARPQYAEVPEWYSWLEDDIRRYEDSGLAGRLGGPVWNMIGLPLVGAGLLCLWRWRSLKVMWLMALWAAAMVGGLYYTPVIWQRYYLPLQLTASVIAGLGLAEIARRAALWRAARRAVAVRATETVH